MESPTNEDPITLDLAHLFWNWLNTVGKPFQYELKSVNPEDEEDMWYCEGLFYDRCVTWFQNSKKSGEYTDQFRISNDAHSKVIMPAIHEFLKILNILKSSNDIWFEDPETLNTLFARTLSFEESVNELLQMHLRREAFAMGMLDRLGHESLVRSLVEQGLIDVILHHTIV
jgi:hypothetical protein